MIKYILNRYRLFGQESCLETEFHTVAQASLKLVALLLLQLFKCWFPRYESGSSTEKLYAGAEFSKHSGYRLNHIYWGWGDDLLYSPEEETRVQFSALMWVGSQLSDSSSRESDISGLYGPCTHGGGGTYPYTDMYAHAHNVKQKHLKRFLKLCTKIQ